MPGRASLKVTTAEKVLAVAATCSYVSVLAWLHCHVTVCLQLIYIAGNSKESCSRPDHDVYLTTMASMDEDQEE